MHQLEIWLDGFAKILPIQIRTWHVAKEERKKKSTLITPKIILTSKLHLLQLLTEVTSVQCTVSPQYPRIHLPVNTKGLERDLVWVRWEICGFKRQQKKG